MATGKNSGDEKQDPGKALAVEPRYRNLVDNTHIVIADVSVDGDIIYGNRAGVRMLGYDSLDELRKENIIKFWHNPEQREGFISKLRQDGYVNDYEIEYLTKSGKIVYTSASAMLDGDMISMVIIDVTKRRQAEETERITAERFRQVTEHTQEWIWEVDLDGLYTYSSSAVEKILGYKPSEIVGKKHFYDLFCPEEREVLKSAALSTFSQKQPYLSYMNLNVHKNGNVVWLSTSGMPILDEHGELRGYRGSDTDVTERKKSAEELLIDSEIIANMTDGVRLVRDEDGIIVMTNPAFERMFGYTPGELIGKHFSVVHASAAENPEEEARNIISVLDKTGNWQGETFSIRKDGSPLWNYAKINSIDHPRHGKVWVSVHIDLTDRKKADADKEQLLHDIGERLKELQCMYSISNSIATRASIGEIFQDTVAAIPPGWHYPEITRGKLRYKDKEWVSESFEETNWKQSSDIIVAGKPCGSVEVYFLEERPTLDEGPFMAEERKLIDNIARTLSETLERMRAEDDMRESRALFDSYVSVAPVGIAVLDSDLKYTKVNETLAGIDGVSIDDHLGKRPSQIIPGEARSRSR